MQGEDAIDPEIVTVNPEMLEVSKSRLRSTTGSAMSPVKIT
jgi:hypothetical protein